MLYSNLGDLRLLGLETMAFIWVVVFVILQDCYGVTPGSSILRHWVIARLVRAGRFPGYILPEAFGPFEWVPATWEVGGRTGRYDSIPNHLCFGWDASVPVSLYVVRVSVLAIFNQSTLLGAPFMSHSESRPPFEIPRLWAQGSCELATLENFQLPRVNRPSGHGPSLRDLSSKCQAMSRSTRDRSRPGRNATSARQPSNRLPGFSNGLGGNDTPPHAPGQLPDAPPVGGSASGSGGADGSNGDSSGEAEDVPASHTDPDHAVEELSHVMEPPQDDETPNAEIESEVPTGGVGLSTINDPAATAADFAPVGQLLVTQQVISAATAKCIFQGELNLERPDSAAAAGVDPALPGDVPPARFGVRQDPSSFVVGVPAIHTDMLSEHFMRDGYGSLETLMFVETLSDEDIQDLSEMTNSRLSIRPELLLPRSADSADTVPEFRELLGGGSRDGSELLEKLSEISDMKTGFALLNQHWKEAFLVSKRQLYQEIADHTRDFKRVAQIHEREQEALRSKLAAMTQERVGISAYARSLKRQLKAGSLNVPRVMNFLNQHRTQVVGNWPRLKALLEHLKDHQVPPNNWTTQIMVTATDDYLAQPGHSSPWMKRTRMKRRRRTVHSVSSRKLQLRPDPYTPSDKDALDPRKSLARTAEEARASLADHAVIWDKQRTDLQLVMRSGLDYLDAFELVNGDHLVHPRIPARELTLMLARMMYWGRLNHTPWAKFVPSWFYKKAEPYLDNLDGAPARWPTLNKLRLDDSAEVMEALFSGVGESEYDEDRDVTFKSSVEFKPQAPRTTPPREAKR
ncbi:unnamed protein product [Phytophthora fragariaefolia]|uniref:Unnamed protein product n=1 Tax=Phytophthora fragariaefolia TaxID=1490495 RepID=A0A9W7CSI9_9STRA|nr:unnamed protein product [Phytophthora fragariaefolia]